jgi:hypothetical protein
MMQVLKRVIQSTLLILASVAVALLLCEGGLRAYFYLVDAAVSPADGVLLRKYFNLASLSEARRLERPIADRYVPSIPIAEGMDQSWFRDSPLDLGRDPRDVAPEAAALQAEYIKRGHFGPQASYIWNEQFVRSQICDEHNQIFRNLPEAVKVFRPPDGRPFPRFRFPPSRTLPSGLKTNRYGFRGRDFPPGHSSEVIRIAFVGSSETISNHHYPFSYPEYFGHWLEEWLRANGYPLHVEIINAGREGIGTTDVAAVLDEEVLPLAPDYVIFYDGANQLAGSERFVRSTVPLQRPSFTGLSSGPWLLPDFFIAHSRLARVADDTYKRYVDPALDEWKRPVYQFNFPAGIDEHNPTTESSDLPLGLPVFLQDLGVMADKTRAAGIPFMISSIVWLDGSELTARGDPNQAQIRVHLKSMFWPLRSPEIRRLIDFSNLTRRKFADSKGIDYLEIADGYPRDPNLFTDAYHMNPEGLRLLAWISLQRFIPRLSQDLRDKKLGKARRVSVQLPPPVGVKFESNCHPTPEMMTHARVLELSSMIRASEASSLEPAPSGVLFHSPPIPWAYIGRMPLEAACTEGGGWVAVNLRVTRGTIGVGVLNRRGDDFVASASVAPTEKVQTVYLRIESFAATSDLIVRNWEGQSSADGLIESVRIAAESGSPVEVCDSDPTRTMAMTHARVLELSSMIRASEASSLEPAPSGVLFHSQPIPWAYIGRMPLKAACTEGGGWVAVNVRVTRGTIGVGVLNRRGDDFVASTSVAPTEKIQAVYLRIDSFAATSDLIVRNWEGQSSADGLIESVRIAAESGKISNPCASTER